MHLTNLLEPWVVVPLIATLACAVMLARGAAAGLRVWRRAHLARVAEGEIALERVLELAGLYTRVGAVVALAKLFVVVLAADKLSESVDGSMCAYGVFAGSPFGFTALGSALLLAVATGGVRRVLVFDRGTRAHLSPRPLAAMAIATGTLALVDLVVFARFAFDVDLAARGSCCSTEVGATGGPTGLVAPWVPWAWALGLLALVGFGFAWRARKRPTMPAVAIGGAASLALAAPALVSVALVVAPHVFETPTETCPFCLLRADAGHIGYPLLFCAWFGASSALGAVLAVVVAKRTEVRAPALAFGAHELVRASTAWLVGLLFGAWPIVNYAMATGGARLLP